ncbi:hypothetical protein PFISCL1PPCAC_22564, partial [Pristionchus fissidentatus]
MEVAEPPKKENFGIRFNFLLGRAQSKKEAVVREVECDLLKEVGATLRAHEITFTVNQPGKTEIVQVDGIYLCIDTEISATADNDRSIVVRATLESEESRNIALTLNAELQDGVERQINLCSEHHELLQVSDAALTTRSVAVMESVTQRVYSMFMVGFCSLTIKIRIYRLISSSPDDPVEDEEEGDIVFLVENNPVSIRRSDLSKCSRFLSAYAHSSMAEASNDVFPIQACLYTICPPPERATDEIVCESEIFTILLTISLLTPFWR